MNKWINEYPNQWLNEYWIYEQIIVEQMNTQINESMNNE